MDRNSSLSEVLKWTGLVTWALSSAAGIAVWLVDCLMAVTTFTIVDLVPSAHIVSLVIISVGTVVGATIFVTGHRTRPRTAKSTRAYKGTHGRPISALRVWSSR